MKIISYNTNGIRAAQKKGFEQWVLDQNPNILCIQETKASADQVNLDLLQEHGYHAYWHSAEKKGYSGTLTLTKQIPQKVILGMGNDKYDSEGRILITEFKDFSLLNCYFPSGTSGEQRQEFKYEFLDDFYKFLEEYKSKHPNTIVLGDFNIAHQDIDIHDPKGNKKSSGFLPEERAWMTKWFSEGGMVDSFRKIHPDKVEYSWWSARFNSRGQNKGWRIDNISVTKDMQNLITAAGHYNQDIHSDHCGVFVELNMA